MDIERLHKKRQKSVEEQIALRKEAIVAAAAMFRDGKIPSAIITWLEVLAL